MDFSDIEHLVSHLSIIKDPRRENGKRHELVNIIIIAMLSILSGGDDWTDMEDFGETQIDFLKSFLELPNGIPSHDTFRRVFSILKPEVIEATLTNWLSNLRGELLEGEVIAIDGKTLRRSLDKSKGTAGLHLVNAWSAERSIILGQVAVKDKSNEIVAIPELLDSLKVEGAVITIDAIGCQKEIAVKIRENKADYVLCLKANHPTFHTQVKKSFEELMSADNLKNTEHTVFETVEKDHGRIETRRCYAMSTSAISKAAEWNDLNSVTMIERLREINGKISSKKHYYISSLAPDAKNISHKIREHWKIENTLHWTLDVIFNEDNSTLRDKIGAQNLSLIRKIAISLIKNEPTPSMSIKRKRKKAGWDTKFLLKILCATQNNNIIQNTQERFK